MLDTSDIDQTEKIKVRSFVPSPRFERTWTWTFLRTYKFNVRPVVFLLTKYILLDIDGLSDCGSSMATRNQTKILFFQRKKQTKYL